MFFKTEAINAFHWILEFVLPVLIYQTGNETWNVKISRSILDVTLITYIFTNILRDNDIKRERKCSEKNK